MRDVRFPLDMRLTLLRRAAVLAYFASKVGAHWASAAPIIAGVEWTALHCALRAVISWCTLCSLDLYQFFEMLVLEKRSVSRHYILRCMPPIRCTEY